MSNRKQRRFALIGWGGIAKSVFGLAKREATPDIACAGILVRPGRETATQVEVGDLPVVSDIAALIALQPELVVECGGHDALKAFGRPVLAAGVDMLTVSSGLLADAGIETELRQISTQHNCRLIVASGALAGVDGLTAAKHAGLDRVVYTGRKPAKAWSGTPAEQLLDLAALREATTFFEGNARDAARLYPKNANVAATIALAGIGFERTEVRLIADPFCTSNIHELAYDGKFGRVTACIDGFPSPDNPKTSFLTALSVWRSVEAYQGAGIVL